jgi:hypothetical protein
MNAHGLFKPSDARRHLLETILAEFLVFFVLEVFGHRAIFVCGDPFAELREQISVFACGMRTIHGDEGHHLRGHPQLRFGIGAAVRRQLI